MDLYSSVWPAVTLSHPPTCRQQTEPRQRRQYGQRAADGRLLTADWQLLARFVWQVSKTVCWLCKTCIFFLSFFTNPIEKSSSLRRQVRFVFYLSLILWILNIFSHHLDCIYQLAVKHLVGHRLVPKNNPNIFQVIRFEGSRTPLKRFLFPVKRWKKGNRFPQQLSNSNSSQL